MCVSNIMAIHFKNLETGQPVGGARRKSGDYKVRMIHPLGIMSVQGNPSNVPDISGSGPKGRIYCLPSNCQSQTEPHQQRG